MTAFQVVKDGNSSWEQEDAFAFDEDARPGQARCIVVDGATEAYDSQRWVEQLCRCFVRYGDHRVPELTTDLEMVRHNVLEWIGKMQEVWTKRTPRFRTVFEERKYHDSGSFATMLCCGLHLSAGRATWIAGALGDTVLFHVRDGRLVRMFPQLTSDDFGSNPAGVFTLESQRPRMAEQLLVDVGELAAGDFLYIATDALAHWIRRRVDRGDDSGVWNSLSQLLDVTTFARLVHDLRSTGGLKNDDVTLMRVICADRPTKYLAIPDPRFDPPRFA